jgi:hypothetical protein
MEKKLLYLNVQQRFYFRLPFTMTGVVYEE